MDTFLDKIDLGRLKEAVRYTPSNTSWSGASEKPGAALLLCCYDALRAQGIACQMMQAKAYGTLLSGSIEERSAMSEPMTRFVVCLSIGNVLWGEDFGRSTSWEEVYQKLNMPRIWSIDRTSIEEVEEGLMQQGRRNSIDQGTKARIREQARLEIGFAQAEQKAQTLEASTPKPKKRAPKHRL